MAFMREAVVELSSEKPGWGVRAREEEDIRQIT